MDQHPIPQDVTGFQFKLFGPMTVKQFGYVASGVVLAVVFYYTPLPGIFWILLKLIFIPILGGSGAFVAFVPIEGRPVEVMATNFLKAVFSPNQYLYQKAGRQFSFSTISLTPVTQKTETQGKRVTATTIKTQEHHQKNAQLQAYLQTSHSKTMNALDQKELTMLKSLALPTPVAAPQAVIPQTTVSPAAMMQTPQAVVTQPQLQPLAPAPQPQPVMQPIQAAPQLQPMQTVPTITSSIKPTLQKTDAPKVSDTPNVLIGIVKDPRGNILPNILIEVKDKNGSPVRAFKTNPLGQFASATPLPKGSYTIELEDLKKQHTFEVVSVVANDQIMQPIQITSHDAREALRQQLFN